MPAPPTNTECDCLYGSIRNGDVRKTFTKTIVNPRHTAGHAEEEEEKKKKKNRDLWYARLELTLIIVPFDVSILCARDDYKHLDLFGHFFPFDLSTVFLRQKGKMDKYHNA